MHTTANPALLRAQSLLARNFAIIPLHPLQKDPDFALVPRVDGVPGTGGAARRTRDINIVRGWCEASPDANIGVCSDDQITILESDSEQEFRQKVREVSRAKFGEARELPSQDILKKCGAQIDNLSPPSNSSSYGDIV